MLATEYQPHSIQQAKIRKKLVITSINREKNDKRMNTESERGKLFSKKSDTNANALFMGG